MPWLLLLIALLVLLSGLIWLSVKLLGLVLLLGVAGVIGALADLVVPGKLPYGWLGAIVAGLLGSFLGTLLLGAVGPRIAGIPVISAFVGAVIVAFAVELLAKRSFARH